MAIFKKSLNSGETEKPAVKKRYRIMLVDDEPANLLVLSSVLEDDYELVCANSANEALKMIAGMPDVSNLRLIICDQRMPGMTGTELLEKLKESHPHIIRILLTGYSDINAIMDGVNKAQLYRYMTKPFDRNDMLMTVRRAIELAELEEARHHAEEVSNQHLQRLNEALSSTNRLKDLFLATVSHELRTPMHGVVGNLELMRTAALDENTKKYLYEAIDSAQQMRQLLDEILGYTELQTGTLKLNMSIVNLRSLLQSLTDVYQSFCDEKGLQFHFMIDEAVPTHIMTDAEQLTHILRHLLDNALKFTEHGQMLFKVDIKNDNPANPQIQFLVKDSGRGISDAHLENLFERFQQADQRFSRRFGGLGLGLAICKGLTQLFNGTLQVASQVGEGSHFVLTLPLSGTTETPKAPDAAPAVPRSLQGLRVLAVDDNPVNLKVINAMLQRLGCDTQIACNGVEALEKIQSNDYQIILMDCQMPVMDGFEATQKIKEMPRYRQVPIIAFTANAAQRDWERAHFCGMCDLLKKPVTLSQLSECLSKWADKVPAPDASA